MKFSPQQKQVLLLWLLGKNNREVAQILDLNYQATKQAGFGARRKLGAKSQTEAVRIVLQNQLREVQTSCKGQSLWNGLQD